MKGHVKATTVPAPKLRVRPPNPLRQHQIDALTAVQTDVARQQLIMACGTGKTLTGQHAVAKLLGEQPGTVLVLVPTLSLLEQTFQAWAAHAPFGFDAIAVCSKLTAAEKRSVGTEDDTDTGQLSLAATTEPAELADFLAGPEQTTRVVFGTYQSLGTVIAAHTDHGADPWNIVVCDEAHRTAGAKAKPFARVLHDGFVPASQRLFLTATPRVHTVSEKESGSEKAALLASMDDETLYGKQVYTLSVAEAIEKDILSQYRVAVIGVEDAELHAAVETLGTVKVADHELSLDHVAAIVALSKAAQQYGLQAIIAFFNSIKSSKGFRDAFNTVHTSRVGARLAEGVAEHIDGAMKLEKRRAALTRLAQYRDNGFYLVSNARCLSEGIDVPVLDAVLFGEPRSSQIEVVQCVGRAIRKNPRHDNPALIVIGVRIGVGEDTESAVDESQFKKIRQVIAALADHDPRIAEAARVLARSGGSNPDDSVDEKINWARELLALEVPETLLHSGFGLRMLDVGDRNWEEKFQDVSRHAQRVGNVSFPHGEPQYSWLSNQRRAFHAGKLSDDRIKRLEALPGWGWNTVDDQWEEKFQEVSRHAQLTGNVSFPRGEPQYSWMARQRRAFHAGKLSDDRIKRLEAFPGWCWDIFTDQWEKRFAEVSRHAQLTGNVSFPNKDVRNVWVYKQRMRFRAGKLSDYRIKRLEALPGWGWNPCERWKAGEVA
ncbi:DEAD/DEAH box helicase [Mycobacteroides abscessus]|uniref:DEAD/DEAH box helicase n=1 Tax=Mycobacteroides abscessus TaxID=36809 RepID=UPI00092B7009|nr:DEAD/DEAH box helicase [Mycobacteroides abscessus]SHU03046.1 putative helicase [Mycobacteroides abscessus subsp. bolletii]